MEVHHCVREELKHTNLVLSFIYSKLTRANMPLEAILSYSAHLHFRKSWIVTKKDETKASVEFGDYLQLFIFLYYCISIISLPTTLR